MYYISGKIQAFEGVSLTECNTEHKYCIRWYGFLEENMMRFLAATGPYNVSFI
jgi:hypothetical protein